MLKKQLGFQHMKKEVLLYGRWAFSNFIFSPLGFMRLNQDFLQSCQLYKAVPLPKAVHSSYTLLMMNHGLCPGSAREESRRRSLMTTDTCASAAHTSDRSLQPLPPFCNQTINLCVHTFHHCNSWSHFM